MDPPDIPDPLAPLVLPGKLERGPRDPPALQDAQGPQDPRDPLVPPALPAKSEQGPLDPPGPQDAQGPQDPAVRRGAQGRRDLWGRPPQAQPDLCKT